MEVQLWMAIPFALMLLIIAIAPLAFPEFWESNRNKLILTLAIGVPTAIALVCMGFGKNLLHQIFFDYIPFIMLLLTLYVVTGGIRIKGDVVATPAVNAAILGWGYVLASIMGTTGAAMLLIRPLLDINKQRTKKVHTVLFFIAMVANCGGVLTPLGDPPLFLLYLRGAPFLWFSKLLPQWLCTGAVLMIIYVILERRYFKQEPLSARKREIREQSPMRIKGKVNFIYLLVVVLSVLFINPTYLPFMESGPVVLKFLREFVFAAVIFLSLRTTQSTVRKYNHFSWAPITEVAILFIGIFVTMVPAMMYLNLHAAELGFNRPYQFYYMTGMLSSFLDNSPTAIAFYEVAQGLGPFTGATVAGITPDLLEAISIAAVFFGSLTYIGNGPNFMVASIASQEGVKMPSFFGYMWKFSLRILLPVFILIQIIFLGF